MNNVSLAYSIALIVGDFLALVAAFVGAYILRVSVSHKPTSEFVTSTTYLKVFLMLLPFWVLIFGLMGLYNSSIYEKRFKEAGRLLIGSFLGLLFVTGIAYFSNTPIFPAKLVPVYGFMLAFIFLIVFRTLARSIRSLLFSYDVGITNILIVGSTKMSEELIEMVGNRKKSGYRILGIVTTKKSAAKKYQNLHVFKNFDEAVEYLKMNNIHSIIQTELYADNAKNNDLLEFAQTHHISFRFIPGNNEMFMGNIEVELFKQSLPIVTVHQTALVGWGRMVKRTFDLAVSIPVLIIVSPILLAIIVVELITGGDVFFRQARLTRYNKIFYVYKFRSHKHEFNKLDPEEAFAKMGKPELVKKYRENGDWLPNDPRVSKLGKFLRPTSLDELPQLFNIIKGDISLVGPRPLIPRELSVYEKKHTILSVKSGLTGLAQVSGRKNIGFEERRKLDMYYVQNWSFWMDVTILFKTVRAVIRGLGAK